MDKICQNCDREFQTHPSAVGRFCSKRCDYDWRKKQPRKLNLVEARCIGCKKLFKAYASANRLCCGATCRAEHVGILLHERAQEEDFEPRFWEKVEKGPGCWIWTGARSENYGHFKKHGKVCRAHVVSYELATGNPVPYRMYVLHRCDNPPCVNPAHLFLGDHQANMTDKKTKNRASRPPRGEANWNAKLTEQGVRAILVDLDRGVARPAIADKYNVSVATIAHIATGRRWGWVRVRSRAPMRHRRLRDRTQLSES